MKVDAEIFRELQRFQRDLFLCYFSGNSSHTFESECDGDKGCDLVEEIRLK